MDTIQEKRNLTIVKINVIIVMLSFEGGYMRKSVNKEQKQEKSVVSVKKILIISMVVFAIMGMMGVMASNTQAKNVKIILASGYEMNVMTTSTTVSDILDENNIEILDGEIVTPDLNSKLSDNKTIKISTEEKHDETPESYFTEDEILKSYTSIVEKIVTVKEDIPFETITKDISGENGNKQEKVTQVGVNGVKEVTYKIQYQNGNEISKEKISENVIKEPVNKIVEVKTKAVTSRSSTSRAVSGSVAEYQSYAKSKCESYGWSTSDYNALVALWNKESGWNPNACNPSSGAYGIPQNNNSSKYASWYRNNAYAQIDWGLSYIKSRYGTPSAAWNKSRASGWY